MIYPLFFATIAFFVFRAGDEPTDARLRRARRRRDGHVVDGQHLGRRPRCSGSAGGGRSSCSSPRRGTFALVLLPADARRLATVGIYNLVATLLWGRLLFGIDLPIEHPLLFALSVVGDGARPSAVLGFLFAVSFVRYRAAWALGNFFEYPVWLICGFLVPLALLPELGAADLLGARRRPGAWTRSAQSALGGSPWPDLGPACLGLGAGVRRGRRALSSRSSVVLAHGRARQRGRCRSA